MIEFLQKVAHGIIPFMVISNVNNKPQINTSRIIEALIIGLVGGAFGGYVTLAKMEVRIDNIDAQLRNIQAQIESRITRVEAQVESKFSVVGEQIRTLETRLWETKKK